MDRLKKEKKVDSNAGPLALAGSFHTTKLRPLYVAEKKCIKKERVKFFLKTELQVRD